ncbi:MAG: hypothetical protein K2N05_03730 [Muribaculaceae bacterium]|nr:hypothetical protein [Muribaculaceae bacterium]
MKKIVFIYLLLCFGLIVHADLKEIYHPILEDGKVWILSNTWDEKSDKEPYKTKVWLDGDTIIGEVPAKLLALQNQLPEAPVEHKAVLEINRQLFFYYEANHRWLPLLDFNCNKGDFTLPLSDGSMEFEGYEIEDVGTVEIFNNEYRYVKTKYDYWIEGIGSPLGNYLLVFPVPTCVEIPNTYLNECYKNEELIFSYEKWKEIRQGLSGVNSLKINIDTPDIIFDLHGRRVTNPQPGSVYIRGGKKFVAK